MQDWAGFDLLCKASVVVIALGGVNLVKTFDKGCQTGHKSEKLFQDNDFVDHFCIP